MKAMRALRVEPAGLNSTPELTWTFILAICLQALKVSLSTPPPSETGRAR
jgi:hypothetical protein